MAELIFQILDFCLFTFLQIAFLSIFSFFLTFFEVIFSESDELSEKSRARSGWYPLHPLALPGSRSLYFNSMQLLDKLRSRKWRCSKRKK